MAGNVLKEAEDDLQQLYAGPSKRQLRLNWASRGTSLTKLFQLLTKPKCKDAALALDVLMALLNEPEAQGSLSEAVSLSGLTKALVCSLLSSPPQGQQENALTLLNSLCTASTPLAEESANQLAVLVRKLLHGSPKEKDQAAPAVQMAAFNSTLAKLLLQGNAVPDLLQSIGDKSDYAALLVCYNAAVGATGADLARLLVQQKSKKSKLSLVQVLTKQLTNSGSAAVREKAAQCLTHLSLHGSLEQQLNDQGKQ